MPLVWNWHIDALCEHYEALFRGEIRHLVVNIPPGTMKSLIYGVFWPAWVWLQDPTWQGVFTSYAMDLAVRDSLRCRDLVESDWYREWFRPSWKLRDDLGRRDWFGNDAGGWRLALSVGSKATGFRGDHVGSDDPLNASDAYSEAKRLEANRFVHSTLATRLRDPRKGTRCIVMQRVHEDDPSGRAIARGGWERLKLPMEFDPSDPCETSLGFKDPRTEPGELLFPELFPLDVVERLKVDLGSSDAAGQLQQEPSPSDGDIFKTGWFGTYSELPDLKFVGAFWDTALKAKEHNDETACTVAGWGEDGFVYILRITHGRWETPDVAAFLAEQSAWLKARYGAAYKGDFVEDKVSGTTLMQYLRRSHPGLAVIPIRIDKGDDKVSRARGVSPIVESGRVLLPDADAYPLAQDWVADLLHQARSFPKGQHDDILDTFVYSVMRFMGTLKTRQTARRAKVRGAF